MTMSSSTNSSTNGSNDTTHQVNSQIHPESKLILIVGRRGRGKSSLGNLLIEGPNWRHNFSVSHSNSSCNTKTCAANSIVIENILLHDTTGYDDTVQRSVVVSEIETIIKKYKKLHGVLFVLECGRVDAWDTSVFNFYLQFLLAGVPNEMIGIVITNSKGIYLNNVNAYLDDNRTNHLLNALQDRSNGKICSIMNEDPSTEDPPGDGTRRRETSLQNVKNIINSFEGEYPINSIISEVIKRYHKWTCYIKDNAFELTALGYVLSLGTALFTLLSRK